MKIAYRLLMLVALLAIAGTAHAQTTRTPKTRDLTEQQKQRLEQNKQQLEQRRETLKQNHDQLTAQRKELMEQLRDLQKSIRDQVKAGTLTKEKATEQLKAWRDAHKPPT
jgi:septal ring factor EnvC (AmiA/AmiB activator)